MWSLRIPESARLPRGLGVGGKVGKGTRRVYVLERGSLQMCAGMDLLVLMGASLFLDQWNKPICAPTAFPPGRIQWALCKGIKALACSAGRRALGSKFCGCVAMSAAVGPDSRAAGAAVGLGAAANSLSREVGLCTMHLCPLKVSRSPLGVGCGDGQKDMPRKDPSPGRSDGGVCKNSFSVSAGPGLGAEADTFCVGSDLNSELESQNLNLGLHSPALGNR